MYKVTNRSEFVKKVNQGKLRGLMSSSFYLWGPSLISENVCVYSFHLILLKTDSFVSKQFLLLLSKCRIFQQKKNQIL